MGKKILNNILIFVAIFLVLQFFFGNKNSETDQRLQGGTIGVTTTSNEFSLGDTITVKLRNNSESAITLANECPNEPLNVYRYENEGGVWQQIAATPQISCDGTNNLILQPEQEITIKYENWSHALFQKLGKYKIGVPNIPVKTSVQDEKGQPHDSIEEKEVFSNEFEVKPQGLLKTVWNEGLYKPIYNALIFLVKEVPGHDLGFAIILLTMIIRLILLIPNQKALQSQKKMQEVQPRLEAVKEKFKGDQQRIAQETMSIWKEHKVNPFGSCLPLLIQFPFLIAVFYVVQTGINPDNSYLLYESLKSFPLSTINVNFLGILDLTKINIFWLPLLVGLLQFGQMKLAMAKNANKPKGKSEMEIASTLMVYVMPVMIAVFAASTPAGVGIYWAISTLFGIGQQLVVNNQSKKNSSKVELIG